MNKMKLSVSMIVKNEEACLGRCLESVKEADEIVIIDTGSTDKTGKIARKYTDKYYENEYKWNDNFAEARNFSLSKCTGDWVLAIDADEILVNSDIAGIKKEIAKARHNAVGVLVSYAEQSLNWWFPKVFRRDKEIYWKGAIHNYLCNVNYFESEIKIIAYSSPSHSKDSNRTLRILEKEVARNPAVVRELYYLGREYYTKRDWIKALYWLRQYLSKGGWAAERADAFLLTARSLWNLHQGEEARATCMEAIRINADFKEAIEFMAYISGPKNKERWLEFAETATSKDVLIDRTVQEQSANYYDRLFMRSSDFSRYDLILKKVAEWASGKVLDIGCGTAGIQKHFSRKDYHGFDISKVAINEANNSNIWQGSAYDEKNYIDGFDTYIATEVFEHLDDIRIIRNIPAGKEVIFSVPSFPDRSHLRMYTEQIIRKRYRDLIDIKEIIRFNWHGKWLEQKPDTNDYILLVRGEKTN